MNVNNIFYNEVHWIFVSWVDRLLLHQVLEKVLSEPIHLHFAIIDNGSPQSVKRSNFKGMYVA